MEISKRLSEKIGEVRKLNGDLKIADNKIKEQEDKISALQTQLGIEEDKVKKWEKLQANGYCWLIKDMSGMVIGMGTVPSYSQFTYTQNVPKEIGTMKYSKLPFYIEENNGIKIDTQKYMRYNSI